VAPDACGNRSCHGVGVAREPPAALRPAVAFAREAALVGFAILVYFGVRGLTEGRVGKAYANARELLRIEDALGVAWELEIQAVILGHDVLTALANWVYVYGHWPLIAACGVLLYVYRRDRYRLLRNAMIISGLIGFVFFAAVPVAPPRLIMPEIVDTVTEYSSGYRALQPPALTNQYAALPSLHFGWNLLLGIVLFQATTRIPVRAFAVAMPVAMAFAVVATANHYVLDVALGAVVVLVGLAAAYLLRARTLGGGDWPSGRNDRDPGRPLRGGAQVGQLAERPAGRGGAGSADDRGGRAPPPRPPRGAPPEDARAGSGAVGPVEAREPVGAPAPPP
jgi:PAP2 superfamily